MTPRRSPNETFLAQQPFHACRDVAANLQSHRARGPGERRWCMRGLIAVNLILLNACAHHSFACALGHYYGDCPPGTTAYEEHNARAIAAEIYEDAVCKSVGLSSGSPAYTECRANLASELDPDTRAALSAMSKLRGDQLQFEHPAEESVP
jgi:hypothetical protein